MDIMTDGPTLRLSGELTGRSTAHVRDAIHDHVDRHGARAVIDLVAVTMVDVTALRMLAAASTRAGSPMHIRGASVALRRLLHLTRLHRFFVLVERTSVGV